MSPLALLYNHRSVNENHHCCFTFKLLSQPDTNVLAAIPPAEWRQVTPSLPPSRPPALPPSRPRSGAK